MQMSDTRQIAATPAEVYAALLDPEMLQTCVPGAQDVTGSVEEGYDATVVQKVGPVKATFKGHVKLSDLVPNEALTITGEGKGGAAGFAKKMADQFFDNLQSSLEGPTEETGESAEADEDAPAKKGWFSRAKT